MKIFLGGTCNGSLWREWLTPKLTRDYFNPVVSDWNEEAIKREEKEKAECDILLFVITPLMKGVYSIAEVVAASHTQPFKTVLCVLDDDTGEVWEEAQRRSLYQVEKLVKDNGSLVFHELATLARYLNH